MKYDTTIPESLWSHFIRFAGITYGDKENAVSAMLFLYEESQATFAEVLHSINFSYADWRQDWEQYKKYNKL